MMRRLFLALALVVMVGAFAPLQSQKEPVTEAMLPSASEAGAIGMEYRLIPATNRTEAGDVSSVSATYKTPPAAGEPIDPGDVCEGAGPGGADQGYGPNLCIAVTIARPTQPCADCFTLETVRERFPLYPGTTSEQPAPDPCGQLSSDDTGLIAWPCVESSAVFDTAASARGFDGLDRNVHMTRYRLVGEVEGIHVSMSTDYLTYAVDSIELEYMGDQMSSLAGVVATQIRQELAGVGDGATDGDDSSGDGSETATGDASSSGGSTGAGGIPTANDLPVDYIAPVAVIGGLAAIAAVVVATGAAGAVVGAAGAGAAGAAGATTAAGDGARTGDGSSTGDGAWAPPLGQPPMFDPDTGEILPTDGDKVWFGTWMDPAEAQPLIDLRVDEKKLDAHAAAAHQQFVSNQQAIREDELKGQGFTFDSETNSWKPGPDTHAVLDQQWQDKVSQDPAWQQSQANAQAAQDLIDAQKGWLKKRWEADNKILQEVHDDAMATDAALGTVVKGIEEVKWWADASINLVGEIPGPTQKLKWAYNAITKGIETGYKVDINSNDPPSGFLHGLLDAGLQLGEDIGLDYIGGKVSLKGMSKGYLPDDVWTKSFVDRRAIDGFLSVTDVSQAPLVSIRRIWNNTGTKEVVSLYLQRGKSEIVKIIYEGAGKNPIMTVVKGVPQQ